MKRVGRFALATILMCCAAPVLAGEDPLYQPAPDWVKPAQLSRKEMTSGPTVVLVDVQKRLDGSKVWDYRDIAIRIDSPDTLTSAGTISAGWIPDKGDLIINRVQILRGGEAIDVLGEGARFTVLRREQQLEQRSINGLLTATLAVPGLRVGDVLRMTYTTVQADQALGDKVQSVDGLPQAPSPIGNGHFTISWPKDQPIQWRVGPNVDPVEPVERDDYKVIELALPLPKADDVPFDAPLRYRRGALFQAGSFGSWQEVSKALAPHFATEGTIDPKGEIAAKLAGIKKETKDPLTRAAKAVRIVQDEVSYLANGLDGGNYLPQSPEETWQLRYGDCKAKSLLLLAMLREMGIDADVVVVHSSAGDSAPELLPMPADFDHMIVLARIGGENYWLDGTASGTRLANIGEVPTFRYALPITPKGSDLVPMVQRPLQVPDRTLELVLDQSAGIDMPALYTAKVELNGQIGAGVRAWVTQPNEEYRESFVGNFISGFVGQGMLLDYTIGYDEDTAKAVITAKGISQPLWQFERGIARQDLPALPASEFNFSPDRARPAWRGIPVLVAGPYDFRTDLKVILPEGGRGYELRGREVVNTEIAGTTIKREAAIAGGTLTVNEELAASLAEIDPGMITAEKAKAARFNAGKLSLRAPRDAKRRWEPMTAAERKNLEPLEEAYDRLIEKDPDEPSGYMLRSAFRAGILDWDGALEDLDKGIELQPTPEGYLTRAYYYGELGRREDALADVRAAFDLDPTPGNAISEADALAELGRYDEALDLIEDYEDDTENHVPVLIAKADILGMAGRAKEGLELLDGLLADRPGDPDLLNGKCWQMGAWNLEPDAMLPPCTKAVESADWSPPVLDSRAMAYFRLGRLQEALDDYNAALNSAPGLAPTLYMRGIVRERIGDKEGRRDIEMALRMSPSLKATYARYGIEPGKD